MKCEGAMYRCVCCGCKTISEPTPGTYEVCPVCGWEDDPVQAEDPDYAGGANEVSLNEARKNYRSFGAISREMIRYVRPPGPDEECETPKDSRE